MALFVNQFLNVALEKYNKSYAENSVDFFEVMNCLYFLKGQKKIRLDDELMVTFKNVYMQYLVEKDQMNAAQLEKYLIKFSENVTQQIGSYCISLIERESEKSEYSPSDDEIGEIIPWRHIETKKYHRFS